MSLTPEQAAAAGARETRVAVVAGAGTGKTRVLTERYLRLVRDERIDLRRVLAVTFTEKAARQMKERVREALRALGPPGAALARAAEFAPISTIHSFLARVLRERALDAGVDPRFALADELTAQLLLEEALAATVDGLAPRERELLSEVRGGESYFVALYDAARATPHAIADLRPASLDVEALRARVAAFLEACEPLRATGKTGARLDGLRRLRPRLLALDPEAAPELSALLKGRAAGDANALFKAAKEDWLSDYALLHLSDAAAEIGAAVVSFLERLDAAYAARKRAEGLLDFSDLEREGLKLLSGPAGAQVAADYDAVLVDEYQDVSRIQEAILERLADGRRFFAVGDQKQSIYRFRHADAAVFAELQQRAAVYPLGGSFRSRPELVSFTNAVFRRLFEGTGVAAQDLRAERAWDPPAAPCVEVLAPRSERAAEGRRAEAALLAGRLRDIVEGGAFRYGECALLLRRMSNVTVYERALAALGIPYVVVRGRGYYAAREVVDLAFLLLLLEDPYDRYRSVAVFNSMLCGVPEADLLHLPRDAAWPLWAKDHARPAAIPPERWERLRTFSERFSGWRDAAGWLSTGDLVERILDETRFAELLLSEPDGRRRHANLAKALRRARSSELGAAEFARSLLGFRERELRESEAPIAGENEDAVQIMTVHAAKGLEFPLVAVADVTGGSDGRRGAVLRPDGVFGFTLREHGKPPGYRALRDWDREQDREEDLRLLYVALTRAEERLILSGAVFAQSCDLRLVGPLLDGAEDVRVDRPERVPPLTRRRGSAARVRAALRRAEPLPEDVARAPAAARDLLARLDALVPPPRRATPYVAAVADLADFWRCPRRYRLARMLGIDLDAEPEGYEPRERPDAEEHPRRLLGTALHALLAEMGPHARPGRADLERHLPGATDADFARISAWCGWLREQDCVRRLDGAEQRREMPFLARVANIAVRGVLDLYAPEIPMLVDYKTSSAANREEHAPQVAVYLAALLSMGLPAPARAHLLFVDAQEVVEVESEPLDERIRAFRDAHEGAGDFPPKPGPACAYCDFRSACAAQGVPLP